MHIAESKTLENLFNGLNVGADSFWKIYQGKSEYALHRGTLSNVLPFASPISVNYLLNVCFWDSNIKVIMVVFFKIKSVNVSRSIKTNGFY
jgi:hypothetical protein